MFFLLIPSFPAMIQVPGGWQIRGRGPSHANQRQYRYCPAQAVPCSSTHSRTRQSGFFASIGATCIVATDLPEAALRKLAQHCWEHKLPLFIGRAYGMIGTWRNVLAEHCIVESRPDYSKENFRLTEPFPELQAFVDRFDLASCTHPYIPLTETAAGPGAWVDAQGKPCAPKAHSHVPAFVVLVKALGQWRSGHAGQLPKTSEEKEAFKAMIDGLKARSPRRCAVWRVLKAGPAL